MMLNISCLRTRYIRSVSPSLTAVSMMLSSQVLLALMMDSTLLDVFNYSSATPFTSSEVGGADDIIFPPSGQ